MVSLESYLSYSAWFYELWGRRMDATASQSIKIELFVSFTQGPFAVKQLGVPPLDSSLFMTQIETSPLWRA